MRSHYSYKFKSTLCERVTQNTAYMGSGRTIWYDLACIYLQHTMKEVNTNALFYVICEKNNNILLHIACCGCNVKNGEKWWKASSGTNTYESPVHSCVRYFKNSRSKTNTTRKQRGDLQTWRPPAPQHPHPLTKPGAGKILFSAVYLKHRLPFNL